MFIKVKSEGVVLSREQSTGSSFVEQLLKKYTEYRMLHISHLYTHYSAKNLGHNGFIHHINNHR